jgi:hypothetical protein
MSIHFAKNNILIIILRLREEVFEVCGQKNSLSPHRILTKKNVDAIDLR